MLLRLGQLDPDVLTKCRRLFTKLDRDCSGALNDYDIEALLASAPDTGALSVSLCLSLYSLSLARALALALSLCLFLSLSLSRSPSFLLSPSLSPSLPCVCASVHYFLMWRCAQRSLTTSRSICFTTMS